MHEYAQPPASARRVTGSTELDDARPSPLTAPAASTDHRTVRTTGPTDESGVTDVADREVQQLADALVGRVPTTYERLIKPVVDLVLATVLFVVLSPLLAVIAAAVLAAMGRPILIGQQRTGRGGEPFTMLKFRTMRTDRRQHRVDRRSSDRRRRGRLRGPRSADRRDGDRRVTHKTLEDPRHTRTGRLLRKLSLDELPQLCNVIGGHMSMVGPRPELHHLTEGFESWQHARHLVRPGITGLWQTTKRGEGLLLHECIDVDLRYIAELSAGTDLAILLRTPFALLRNKGVI